MPATTSRPSLVFAHTEFFRLLCDVEDAAMALGAAIGPFAVENAYSTLMGARRDIHLWVSKNTPLPEKIYRTTLRF